MPSRHSTQTSSSSTHPTGVLLVGEIRLHLEGLAALLNRDGRLRVVGVAASVEAATTRADVIVVDNGVDHDAESMRRVIGGAREPMVVLGAPADEHRVIALARSGVIGFTERDASIDDLVTSVLTAARGEASLPTRIATTLLRRATASPRPAPADAGGLTTREREIVALIEESLSNKEIAARLCIEVATVKNHVHNILNKLQISRRAQAPARLRLVDPDESSGGVRFMARTSVG